MLVTFRSIFGKAYKLEIPPNTTVKDCKRIIRRETDIKSKSIKLIYKSTCLKETDDVTSLNLTDDDCIVIHIPSERPPPPPPENKTEKKNDMPSVQPLPDITQISHESTSRNSIQDNLIQLYSNLEGHDSNEASDGEAQDDIRLEMSLNTNDPLMKVFRDYLETNPELASLVQMDPIPPSYRNDEGQDAESEYLQQLQINEILGNNANQPSENIPVIDLTHPSLNDFTEEEKQRIGRLQALGFDQNTVIQVFLACGKDEKLTYNCLLNIDH